MSLSPSLYSTCVVGMSLSPSLYSTCVVGGIVSFSLSLFYMCSGMSLSPSLYSTFLHLWLYVSFSLFQSDHNTALFNDYVSNSWPLFLSLLVHFCTSLSLSLSLSPGVFLPVALFLSTGLRVCLCHFIHGPPLSLSVAGSLSTAVITHLVPQ